MKVSNNNKREKERLSFDISFCWFSFPIHSFTLRSIENLWPSFFNLLPSSCVLTVLKTNDLFKGVVDCFLRQFKFLSCKRLVKPQEVSWAWSLFSRWHWITKWMKREPTQKGLKVRKYYSSSRTSSSLMSYRRERDWFVVMNECIIIMNKDYRRDKSTSFSFSVSIDIFRWSWNENDVKINQWKYPFIPFKNNHVCSV